VVSFDTADFIEFPLVCCFPPATISISLRNLQRIQDRLPSKKFLESASLPRVLILHLIHRLATASTLYYLQEPTMGEHVPTETNAHAAGPTDEDSVLEGLREKADPFTRRTGHELKWMNVDVKVARKEKANIHVLQNISGTVRPQQLSCIMGHSGAGYVQLVKALSTRFFFVSLTDLVPSIRLSD
jgi:ABC-type multidrug transport system fused ATPase/permease subunit